MPNFGADPDIATTTQNLAVAEKNAKHDFKVGENWQDDKGNYAMVQTDADINMKSDPICSSAGCTQYKHKTKDRGYKIDYFVPHFGEDDEISNSKKDLALVENIMGHKLDIKAGKGPKVKRGYFVPHFGEDPEITATKQNLASAEKDLGHELEIDSSSVDGKGSFGFVQTGADIKMKSDPICSSAGCT